jgi:hypothetical protein
MDRNEILHDPLTLQFHRVCPRQFLSLWYVWHKLRTYLARRLALSPNKLTQASTLASSPRSTIGCVQNDFRAGGTFGANRATILHQDKHYVQTERNKLALEPRPL